MTFALVEATRDRSGIGRSMVSVLTAALLGGAALISQFAGAGPARIDPPTASGADRRLVVPGDVYGQCYVAAHINGSLYGSLLLDSGASGHLTFGRNHAAQLGFDPAKLAYSYRYGSANGIGHYASIRVREFRLESFVMHDVPAEITEASQQAPLLGIDILRHLNLHLRDGKCELSWS
jgi:clan AA aspartic protease (TIGR02281 family)